MPHFRHLSNIKIVVLPTFFRPPPLLHCFNFPLGFFPFLVSMNNLNIFGLYFGEEINCLYLFGVQIALGKEKMFAQQNRPETQKTI